MEMFLIRLIHLKDIKKMSNINYESLYEEKKRIKEDSIEKDKEEDLFDTKSKVETAIGQIKNIAQEKDLTLKENNENKKRDNIINSFDDLLEICSLKKEVKLKYELEKNVNLVRFENQRIEISFNEDLDKEFVKNLSSKLYDWTQDRWIITLTKTKGMPSKKEKENNLKKELIKNTKESAIHKNILEIFSDAELTDVIVNEEENRND